MFEMEKEFAMVSALKILEKNSIYFLKREILFLKLQIDENSRRNVVYKRMSINDLKKKFPEVKSNWFLF